MLAMQESIGSDCTHEQIKAYLWETLNSGRVVPGYVPRAFVALCTPMTTPLLLVAMATVSSATPIHDSPPSSSSAMSGQS